MRRGRIISAQGTLLRHRADFSQQILTILILSANNLVTGTQKVSFQDISLSRSTWNHYSYVLNNPLSFVDPDGWSEENSFQASLLGQEITIVVDKKILEKRT